MALLGPLIITQTTYALVVCQAGLTIFRNVEPVILALLGLPGVGRSTLLRSLTQGTTSKSQSTANGEVFDTFTVLVDGAAVDVRLLAPAFSIEAKSTDVPPMDDVDGMLLVYDISDRNSLDPLIQWYSVRESP